MEILVLLIQELLAHVFIGLELKKIPKKGRKGPEVSKQLF